MYKVIIADSYMEIGRNFKSYINTKFKSDFKIIKIITDNYNIHEVIDNLKPDLLIGDIRFFGTISYKSIKDLHEEFPNIKFILYGSINDVDYLEQAVELGTLDYMTKPIKPSDLSRSLELAKEKFEKIKNDELEEKNIYIQYNKNKDLFKHYIFDNLIHGILENEEEIKNSLNYFKVDIRSPYTILSLEISDFKQKIIDMDDEEKNLQICKVISSTEKILIGKNSFCKINSFNNILIILGEISDLSEIIKIAEEIKEEINKKYNIMINIGIGRSYNQLKDIFVSFREARSALKYKYYMSENSIIPIDYVEPYNNITFRYPIEKEQKLIHLISIGDFEKCKYILNNIFDSLRFVAPLPEKLLPQIIINILMSIIRYFKEQNNLQDINTNLFFSINDAVKIETTDEGYLYLYNIVEKFCTYIINERKKYFKSMLDIICMI